MRAIEFGTLPYRSGRKSDQVKRRKSWRKSTGNTVLAHPTSPISAFRRAILLASTNPQMTLEF
jgi:hypothetical protein